MSNLSAAARSIGAGPGASLSTLAPELFSLISGLLPRIYCSSSLLSLAMTCRRLRDIIIPHNLYRDIYLEGEVQTFEFLTKLRREANEEDIQKGSLPRSHHIHFLSIDPNCDRVDRAQPKLALHELYLLVRRGGLRNLLSLTIHLHDESPRKGIEILQDFWSAIHTECPRLKETRLTGTNEDGIFWVDESGLLRLQRLECLGVEQTSGYTEFLSSPLTTSVSSFTPLRYLELRLWSPSTNSFQHAKELLSLQLPNIRTLILDGFDASQPDLMNDFWLSHSGLRKLVLGPKIIGQWFGRFDESMLPNLVVFGGLPHDARAILPHVAKRLKRLTLFNTHNAQGPYLLRAVTPDGVLPVLRSLSIHLLTLPQSIGINMLTPHASRDSVLEGNRWREDEMGNVTKTSKMKAQRRFDGNYIMSISNAAPHLEELELSGTSEDTLESLTNSLSRLVKLNTLVFSGPWNPQYSPFFKPGHWDESARLHFNEIARQLAEGCHGLEMVCVRSCMGRRDKSADMACRVIRGDDGRVKDIAIRKIGGMIIEREEEW